MRWSAFFVSPHPAGVGALRPWNSVEKYWSTNRPVNVFRLPVGPPKCGEALYGDRTARQGSVAAIAVALRAPAVPAFASRQVSSVASIAIRVAAGSVEGSGSRYLSSVVGKSTRTASEAPSAPIAPLLCR